MCRSGGREAEICYQGVCQQWWSRRAGRWQSSCLTLRVTRADHKTYSLVTWQSPPCLSTWLQNSSLAVGMSICPPVTVCLSSLSLLAVCPPVWLCSVTSKCFKRFCFLCFSCFKDVALQPHLSHWHWEQWFPPSHLVDTTVLERQTGSAASFQSVHSSNGFLACQLLINPSNCWLANSRCVSGRFFHLSRRRLLDLTIGFTVTCLTKVFCPVEAERVGMTGQKVNVIDLHANPVWRITFVFFASSAVLCILASYWFLLVWSESGNLRLGLGHELYSISH